ncbi:MAG TPA: hypothetical protein ENK57_16635 [Polyangiaceae bacterium]|nr:hypothetical protein [Polyangiaceae bacterium]
MSRSRSARYQTALEFRDALLRFLRNYNPKYRRTKLSRFMKRVWNEEIERDLRAMEDFVIDTAALPEEQSLGKNLIAEALGPGAVYSRFSPEPTKNAEEAASEVHDLKTEIIDAASFGEGKPPTKPAGPPKASKAERRTVKAEAPHDPIHDEKTQVVNTRGK